MQILNYGAEIKSLVKSDSALVLRTENNFIADLTVPRPTEMLC